MAGMNAMCLQTVETLTLTGLLADPLIRMVMDSDGVSEEEMRTLMQHMRDVIAARSAAYGARVPEHLR